MKILIFCFTFASMFPAEKILNENHQEVTIIIERALDNLWCHGMGLDEDSALAYREFIQAANGNVGYSHISYRVYKKLEDARLAYLDRGQIVMNPFKVDLWKRYGNLNWLDRPKIYGPRTDIAKAME